MLEWDESSLSLMLAQSQSEPVTDVLVSGGSQTPLTSTAFCAPPPDHPTTLIDIGSNLLDPMFMGIYHGKQKHESDLSQLFQRALENGVEAIILTAGSETDSTQAQEFLERHRQSTPLKLYTTVGIHPTNALQVNQDEIDQHMNNLRSLVSNDSVVAVGELGLDFARLQFAPIEAQEIVFLAQLSLAEESGKPLFLHSRDAEPNMSNLLRQHRHQFRDGVVHSFDGSIDELRILLSLDLYIGINGCSLRTKENLEAVKEIPLERIMLETDSPWCEIKPTHAGYSFVKTVLPVKKKPDKFEWGQGVKGRCEPWMMRQVLEVAAAVKGVEEDTLARHAHFNACRVFKL